MCFAFKILTICILILASNLIYPLNDSIYLNLSSDFYSIAKHIYDLNFINFLRQFKLPNLFSYVFFQIYLGILESISHWLANTLYYYCYIQLHSYPLMHSSSPFVTEYYHLSFNGFIFLYFNHNR